MINGSKIDLIAHFVQVLHIINQDFDSRIGVRLPTLQTSCITERGDDKQVIIQSKAGIIDTAHRKQTRLHIRVIHEIPMYLIAYF